MKRSGYLERRTPLRAQAPLERGESLRRTRMKPKPARRIAKEKELRPRLAFAADRPCVARHLSECRGPVQVAHVGVGGMALKHGSPMETLPMCGPALGENGIGHHQQFDQSKGAFDGWSRAEKAEWVRKHLQEINAAFAAAEARAA